MPTNPDENEDGVNFAVFATETDAARAQDLRAKAEGYPQPGCLRGADYIAEPTDPPARWAMQFWVGYDDEYITNNSLLSTGEKAELLAIYQTAADLPSDWAPPWTPGGDG